MDLFFRISLAIFLKVTENTAPWRCSCKVWLGSEVMEASLPGWTSGHSPWQSHYHTPFARHWPPCGDGSVYFLHLHGYHREQTSAGGLADAVPCMPGFHVMFTSDVSGRAQPPFPLGRGSRTRSTAEGSPQCHAWLSVWSSWLSLGLLDVELSSDLLTLCLEGLGLSGYPGLLFCMSPTWSRALHSLLILMEHL